MTKIRNKQLLGDTPGRAEGFVVKYSSTTAVAITSGLIEGNGSVYTLAADASHSMTSLAAGADFHYIYIDDSGSTAPTAAIIDATTEPSYSDSLRGWYNGDDRCIGVVFSPAASATVAYFDVSEMCDKLIRVVYAVDNIIAVNLNPTGAWQDTTDPASDFSSVNSIELYLLLRGEDAGSRVDDRCCVIGRRAPAERTLTLSAC